MPAVSWLCEGTGPASRDESNAINVAKGQIGGDKLRQNRLCWLTQTRAEKRADTQRSKARETQPMSLVTLTPLALETGHRDLTNRVNTSFTSVGSSADSPARSLRLSPTTGHAAK